MRRRGSSDLGLLSRRRFRSVTHRPVSYLSVSTHLTPSTSRLRGKEPCPAPRIFPFYRGGCHEGDIAKKQKRGSKDGKMSLEALTSPKPSRPRHPAGNKDVRETQLIFKDRGLWAFCCASGVCPDRVAQGIEKGLRACEGFWGSLRLGVT